MKYKLFLDDFRNPMQAALYMHTRLGARNSVYLDGKWVIAKNYDEFVQIIEENGIPEFVSYDHDLADEHYESEGVESFSEKTGLDCAKWLLNYTNSDHPEYAIHSQNPVGYENIKKLLESTK